jgi:hypothetical protein
MVILPAPHQFHDQFHVVPPNPDYVVFVHNPEPYHHSSPSTRIRSCCPLRPTGQLVGLRLQRFVARDIAEREHMHLIERYVQQRSARLALARLALRVAKRVAPITGLYHCSTTKITAHDVFPFSPRSVLLATSMCNSTAHNFPCRRNALRLCSQDAVPPRVPPCHAVNSDVIV